MYSIRAEQLNAEIARALRSNQDELAFDLLRLKLTAGEPFRPAERVPGQWRCGSGTQSSGEIAASRHRGPR